MTVASPDVALDPDRPGDVAVYWRVSRLDGLEFLRATFRTHAYAPHTHETYAVAAILDGCETFRHRGERRYAPTGSVAVVCPDELHDGEPFGEAFEYRTFYPSVALMREIAEDITGRAVPHPPWFERSVIDDPELATAITGLHAVLAPERTPASVLEQDARLIAVLGRLVARYADLATPPPVRRESRAVRRARELLDARFAEEVELIDLARTAGLSRAHLIRAFRRETGLTPHAYQIDRRFRAASRLLERGEAPGAVAAACGFCDQSHLNRVFKARMGVTPGAYRRAGGR
ncbi:AraC family transcriptional regulator [Salinarimonas soli]|uniref:AraC family transcriptional regulator n=1 Tax=Salinarimonas soli TaxID=1638099 RepID=A0A5B2VZN2_9HYPH|nr:AraC family transcriptional regulator [Salinarimonas soli]KAA2244148.1 AraC family transcriptional regulator [Salinarimonas soli]